MTDTTALLRALHYDLVATNGLIAALLYKKGENDSPYAETVSRAIQKAGVYCSMADELEEKDGR